MTFLINCSKCRSLIVPKSICPQCFEPAEGCEAIGIGGADLQAAYAKSMSRHTRNYTIFLCLSLLTGSLALGGAIVWKKFFLLLDASAVVSVSIFGFLALLSGFATIMCRKWLPIEVYCPACNTRLDELGLKDGRCEGCNVTLK